MSRGAPDIRPGGKRLTVALFVLALAGALALAGSAFLAPWLAARNSSLAAPVYRAFSRVCHQIPGRCFYIFGQPLAVCGRCFGTYLGILAGCVVYPFIRGVFNTRLPGRWTFLAFSLPLAVDALGNGLRLWNSGIWLRFATGCLWGLILPFYFLAALAGLAQRRLAIFRPSK